MPNAKIEPVPQGNDTDDDLVELGEDVKKDDFLQLLRVVYPRYVSDRSNIGRNVKELSIQFRKYSNPETLTTDQWQTVLKLSENFGMDDLRRKAVRNLKDFFFAKDPIDALICARQNRLDNWTEPLIEKIVEMRRELTEDELKKVGTPTAYKIAWALGAAGIPMSLDSPSAPMPFNLPGTSALRVPLRRKRKVRKKGCPVYLMKLSTLC